MLYTYLKASTDATQLLYTEQSDAVIVCGVLKEDGVCFKYGLTAISATHTWKTYVADTTTFATTSGIGTSTSGVLTIKTPAGGLGQFRGLTVGTTEDKYL